MQRRMHVERDSFTIIFKASLDAIGTAAGVALPYFGVVAGILGLAVGGVPALVLAITAYLVFYLAASITFYESYTKTLKDLNALDDLIEENESRTCQQIFSYFLKLIKAKELRDLLEADQFPQVKDLVKARIEKDLKQLRKPDSGVHAILNELKNNDEMLSHTLQKMIEFVNEQQGQGNPTLQLLPASQAANKKPHKPPFDLFRSVVRKVPEKQKPPPATVSFSPFFAAFGSILGCSAGIFGILIQVGVLAGLSAIPGVGWIMIGAAIIAGTILTLKMIDDSRHKARVTQITDNYKGITNDFIQLDTNRSLSKAKKRYANSNLLIQEVIPLETVTHEVKTSDMSDDDPHQAGRDQLENTQTVSYPPSTDDEALHKYKTLL